MALKKIDPQKKWSSKGLSLNKYLVWERKQVDVWGVKDGFGEMETPMHKTHEDQSYKFGI